VTEERKVRLELAYDGTDYHGWQLQPRDRTIQGTLEAAIARMTAGRRVPVRGAGRTDAGVHARGQVAEAWVPASLSDEAIRRGLASILPDAIVVREVRTTDPAFHAWRDAVSKTYVYRLDRSIHGDPFRARFALHRPGAVDLAAIEDALSRLPGRRDWSGFADSRCEKEDRVRTLLEARYDERDGSGRFLFRADGFLTRMARNLVGTLLEIGRGRMAPERIDAILATGERTLAGPTAPAKGLCLERVDYARDGRDDDAARVRPTEEDPWNASW
jgi:tRNA pseudouridine38-40 synthase